MNKTLKFSTPAKCFEESLLLGNGFLGAAVYGGTDTERYSMNEATLWSGYPNYSSNPNGPKSLKNAKEFLLKGNYEKAAEEIEQGFTGSYSQTFLPLCTLYIQNGITEYDHYSRHLDMQNGICCVDYQKDDIFVKRESFINNPHNVMAVKITQQNVPITKIYIESNLQCSIFTDKNQLILRGTAPVFDHPIGRRYANSEKRPEYSESDAKKGMRYKGILRVDTDGVMRYNGDMIEVLNAAQITVYFAAKTSFNGFNKHPFLEGAEIEDSCNKLIENALLTGYENLKSEHIKSFSNMFNRTEFKLSNSETTLETDLLLKDGPCNALYEQLFNIGKYLTISGSQKGGQPMNLQGIWNELVCPPWNSNYTININTEMNYLPTLPLNLPECFEPYVEFAKQLAENGRRIAEEWYGVKGVISHHNSDLWRMANPVGCRCKGSHLSSFFNTSFGWILWGLCEKFKIENDMEFLKNVLYPLLTECAETYVALFSEDDLGRLFLSPATSPENPFVLEDGSSSAICLHTTISNAICRDILNSSAEFSLILGNDEAAKRYSDYAKKVMPYEISSSGRIIEWDKDYTEEEINHRHVSHLYGLHPARQITPYNTPELAKAAKKSLDVRGDKGTGWCIAWKANMWARLFDGDRALKLLDNQLNYVNPQAESNPEGGTYPNLLCAHPPFQIDGNFGAVSAIIEILVQCNGNNIYILPALPNRWQSGKIQGIRITGGAFIDIEWQDGKATEVKIYPEEKACNYNLIY